MAGDDWWTQAVDQFGLETPVEPSSASTAVADAPASDPSVAPQARPGQKRRRRRLDFLVIALCALAAAVLLRQFVVEQFAVDGDSMLGTLHSGDRVIVNKLSYDAHDPRHGDIVVLKDVNDSLQVRDLIKRVVALPGETVEYRDCQLYINGNSNGEPYLDAQLVGPDHCGNAQPPVKVESGHVFVMGDNRAESLDSRTLAIGQIPFDHLIGRASVVVWPSSDWGWL
jgi:signal peptidase I